MWWKKYILNFKILFLLIFLWSYFYYLIIFSSFLLLSFFLKGYVSLWLKCVVMRKAVVEKENRSFLTGSYLSFSLPKETATLELRIVIREKNRSESGTREMKRAREKGKSFDLVLSKRGTKRRRLTRSKNSPPVLARHISLCDSRRRVTSVNGNIRPHY